MAFKDKGLDLRGRGQSPRPQDVPTLREFGRQDQKRRAEEGVSTSPEHSHMRTIQKKLVNICHHVFKVLK